MKLNLLPTTVNREGRAKLSWFVAAVFAALGVASLFYMKSTSERYVTEQKARIEKAKPTVEEGVSLNTKTKDLITANQGMIMNAKLAAAMEKHNDVYPDLFNNIKTYIPSFFRVTQMSAAPLAAGSTQVNVTGVIQTQQQYADLMLALLRIDDVVSVGRTGFNYQNPVVPGLSDRDQTGRIQKRGDPVWSDDPLERLNQRIAQASSTGFRNQGGFGTTAQPVVRGAMPDWSQITIGVVVRRDTQSPNPLGAIRATSAMWPKPDMTKGGGIPAPGTGTTGTAPAPGNTPPAGNTGTTPKGRE